MSLSWVILSLISAGFAALVAIFGKIGVQGIDPTLSTAVRAVIMAVFLVAIALTLGKGTVLESLTGRPLVFVALSGIAGALSWLAYFWALKIGPASGVAALDRLSVVFVLVFSVLFLAEGLTWKSGLGATLLTLGAVLMGWR